MFEKLKEIFGTAANLEQNNVIDITDSSQHPIPIRSKASLARNDWWALLERSLPERAAIKESVQLKDETKKLYLKLCGYVEGLMQKEGRSFSEYARRRSDYYDNVLYTLYCVAEGVVTSHYDSRRGFNATYSYQLLQRHLSVEVVETLQSLCETYSANLPKASDQTINLYHLTANGLEYKWWDNTGEIRDNALLSSEAMAILDKSPNRSTNFWQIDYRIDLHILERYLSTIEFIRSSVESSDGKWSTRQVRVVRKLTASKRSWLDVDEYRLPSALLKLAEQGVRSDVRYASALKIEDELISVSRLVPKSLVQQLLNIVMPTKVIALPGETRELLRNSYARSWFIDANSLSQDNFLEIFNFYRSSPMCQKFIDELLRPKNFDNLEEMYIILALYCQSSAGLKPSHLKIRTKLIHDKQIDAFEAIARQDKPITMQLVNALTAMRLPPRQKVVLDTENITLLQAKHVETVAKLNEYLGTDKENSSVVLAVETRQETMANIFASEATKEKLELTDAERELLVVLVKRGALLVAEAKQIAGSHHMMLGGLLTAINTKAYESLGDQLIIQSDDTITIDTSYIDFVRKVTKSEH